MNLSEYLKKHGLSVIEMAEFCGVSRSSIYNAINDRVISIDLALIISANTQGEVSVEELNVSADGKLGRKKLATKKAQA